MMEKNVPFVFTLCAIVWFKWVGSTGTLDQLSVRPSTTLTVLGGRPRSEIDLETEKSVIICAGQNKSLECFSPGSSISIKEAFWGRLSAQVCPSEDGDPVTNCQNDPTTTPIVQRLCDDKEYCEIPARHSVLQPPGIKHCPGVNKYLAVKYACMPEKRKFVLCNGETTELKCGQGWKVHIISAYWGRDSPSTCPTPLGKFFTCANSADSLVALRERCANQESCMITANDEHLTKDKNHCPGIDKYAVITYNCQLHARDLDDESGGEKKLLDLSKNVVENDHSFLDLTSSTKGQSTEPQLGEVNMSMLLPIPQYKTSDKLKPIIEFLDEASSEGNKTSQGEKLPIPQDAHLNSIKKDNSTSVIQDGIAPSMFAKQNGITSALSLLSSENTLKSKAGIFGSNIFRPKPFSANNQTTQVEPGVQGKVDQGSSPLISRPNNDNIQTGPTAPSVDALPFHGLSTSTPSTLRSPTQNLLEGFLASKFGQALGNSLLSGFASLQTSLNKNSAGQNLATNFSHPSVPNIQPPPNKGLIGNIISGLINQPSGSVITNNRSSPGFLLDQGNKKTTAPVKEQSASPDNLSSPTISIGKKVFSVAGLSKLLQGNNDEKEQSKNGLNTITSLFGGGNTGRRHQGKEHKKEKMKQLNEKIQTLETLSDALDALTSKLSPDEKSEDKNSNKEDEFSLQEKSENRNSKEEEEFSLNFDDRNRQGRRHKKHHSHHRKSHQFEEDLNILGSLLSPTKKHSKAESKTSNITGDKKDTNYIIGIRKQNTLDSADLDTLQKKINKAIEMAETMGRHDTSHVESTWLPLLVAGKVVKDVGAQTREEVTKIPTNRTAVNGSFSLGKSDMQRLKEILKRLIENALKKGTFGQLIQRWNHSGSPFAEIARNVSSLLHANGAARKLGLSHKPTVSMKANAATLHGEAAKLASSYKPTVSSKASTAAVHTNTTQQKANESANVDARSDKNKETTVNSLFKKAVNHIIGALRKRHGLHGNSSMSLLPFLSTDTLTTVKGVTLGGRINEEVSTTNPVAGLKAKTVAQGLGVHVNLTTSTFTGNASQSPRLEEKNGTRIGIGGQKDVLFNNHNTSKNNASIANGTGQHVFSTNATKNAKNKSANKTLTEFMKGSEGANSHKLMLNYNKPGVTYKHNRVTPRLHDLLTAVAETLLDMRKPEEKPPPRNPKMMYDQTGIEQLLTSLPNDHNTSDFFNGDPILPAPNDHVDKSNASNIPLAHLFNSTKPSFLRRNRTKKLKMDNHNSDLGETVTVTLETVDDPPTVSPPKPRPANETADTPTSQRSNKIPHYVNLQSAFTLGKINANTLQNRANPFPLSQIHELPTGLSDYTTESSQQITALPSDGDGKLNAISALDDSSANFIGESQTKSSPELPLGLQMKAIGRIAETAQNNQSPGSPSSNSGISKLAPSSDLAAVLAAKSGEVKIVEDKMLPMSSDLTSAGNAKGGETESIVSKAVPTEPPASEIHKPNSLTPTAESEVPAREVKEIARSIHALLKILSTYSQKLKMEEDEDDDDYDSPTDEDTTESGSRKTEKEAINDSNGSDDDKRINIKIDQSSNVPSPHSSDRVLNAFSSKQEQPDVLSTSYNNFPGTRYTHSENDNNKFGKTLANYPQTTPTVPSYVDTGMFENIQEQPVSEVSGYTWSPEHAHAQKPVDSNPTKSSISPQQDVNQPRPADRNAHVESSSNLDGITEAFKELNLPSIEDDPEVREIQKIAAEESRLASGKRKVIQKHQQIASSKSQLTKPGVFSRNTIPNKKAKHHLRKESTKRKLQGAGKKNVTNDTKGRAQRKQDWAGNGPSRNPLVKSRNIIPRANVSKVFSSKHFVPHLKRKHLTEGNSSNARHPDSQAAVHDRKTTEVNEKNLKRGNMPRHVTNRDKIPRGHVKNSQLRFNNSTIIKTVRSNDNTRFNNTGIQPKHVDLPSAQAGASSKRMSKEEAVNQTQTRSQGGSVPGRVGLQHAANKGKDNGTKPLDKGISIDETTLQGKHNTVGGRTITSRSQDKVTKKKQTISSKP